MIAVSPPPPRTARDGRSPWPHRWAWLLVVCTVVGTVGLGATVTTLGAGMAFLDWPTSGGENMFAYNFLTDIKGGRTDKVLEHVHRLAGSLTGLLAIGLAGSLWVGRASDLMDRLLGVRPGVGEPRRWVRWLGVGVLGMVIVQGLAGGFRVTEVSTTLAMLHGHFGACVVAAMFAAVLVTSRGWRDAAGGDDTPAVRVAGHLTTAALVLLVGQYALGGVVRHFGGAVLEHLGGAVLVSLTAAAAAGAGLAGGSRFLRWNAAAILGVLGGQVILGMLAYATRFGVSAVGAVAVVGGPLEVVSRGGHTVCAMLLLSALVCQRLRVVRLRRPANAVAEPAGPVNRLTGSFASLDRGPVAAAGVGR